MSPDPDPESREIAAGLGRAMRARRSAAGLTLAQTANSSGTSIPFLSQIENGRAMPSLLTLHRVAATLGSTAHELLQHASSRRISIVRAGDGPQVEFADSSSSLVRYVVEPGLGMTASELAIPPGVGLDEPITQTGVKLYRVLEGTVEFHVGKEAPYTLSPGDTLCHDGSLPHRWRSVGDGPALVLVVMSNPL